MSTYVKSDFVRNKIVENFLARHYSWTSTLLSPRFRLLKVENNDDFEESSGKVACNFNKSWSLLIKSRTNIFV